jgi:ATP synthase F1 complex assembly factor 2
LIALALIRRQIGVAEATTAARVESLAQIKLWGEVEDTHDVEEQDMLKMLGLAVSAVQGRE